MRTITGYPIIKVGRSFSSVQRREHPVGDGMGTGVRGWGSIGFVQISCRQKYEKAMLVVLR